MIRKRLLGVLLTCAIAGAAGRALPPAAQAAEGDQAAPWASPFVDVRPGDWFAADVEYVTSRGLMTGFTADTFGPDAPLSRGMLVTVLYRAADSPDLSGHINPFDDIAGDEWFADAVIWAATNGIAAGYDGGFYADDSILRQDLALVLWRFGAYIGKDVTVGAELSDFADAGDLALYAVNAMRFAVAAGIVAGRPDGTLDPGGYATRAEASAMLRRFMEFM